MYINIDFMLKKSIPVNIRIPRNNTEGKMYMTDDAVNLSKILIASKQ